MQGFEITEYLNKFPYLKRHYRGIFSIDTLPKFLKIRQFVICNTDISTGNGLHWFCLLRSSKTSIECFDSLGISSSKKTILEETCRFRGIKELEYNETAFQSFESTSCGLFSVYFIINRLHNLDMTFDELLNDIFDVENKERNESLVHEFCDNIKLF
jgi:hypothetical protein